MISSFMPGSDDPASSCCEKSRSQLPAYVLCASAFENPASWSAGSSMPPCPSGSSPARKRWIAFAPECLGVARDIGPVSITGASIGTIGHYLGCDSFGRALEMVRRVIDGDAVRTGLSRHDAGPLLHDVGQFVRHDPHAAPGRGSTMARAEQDVVADGKCPCVQRPSRERGRLIGMNPDAAEILTETRLHESSRRRVERHPGRCQGAAEKCGKIAAAVGRRAVERSLYGGRPGRGARCRRTSRIRRTGLVLVERFFLLAGGAFSAYLRRGGGEGRVGGGHAHDLVGDAVGLVFERIVDRPDNEFRLNDPRQRV